MARRVYINRNDEIEEMPFSGDHVLLSVEEYNKIVRALNLLTLLISQREEISSQRNAIKVLHEQSLPVIEDE